MLCRFFSANEIFGGDMCVIIDFPQDPSARREKVKELMEKKRKTMLHRKPESTPQTNAVPTTKQPAILNTKLTLQITNISELNKTLEATNNIFKYVIDCVYDLSVAVNSFKRYLVGFGIFCMCMTIFFSSLIVLVLYKF